MLLLQFAVALALPLGSAAALTVIATSVWGGVAVDARSNVYYGDCTGGTVRVYNSSANVSYTIAALTGLGQPKGIAVDPTGTLVYVADSWTTAPSRLIQYNRSGQGNVSLVAAGSLPSPVCAKLDPSGSVWVADSTANAAYRFSTSKFNTTTAAVTGIGQPRDMQPDCSGNLWIADYVSNSIKFWSSSTQQMTTVFSGAGMFKQPKGITLDPGNANLYVVNSLSNTVSQVSLRTCIVSTIIGSGMTGAFSVAMDPASGDLFLSDQSSARLLKSSPTVAVLTPCLYTYSAPPCSSYLYTFVASGINSPVGVAAASADVYFCDYTNNLVKVWSATTYAVSVVTGFSGLSGPKGVAVNAAATLIYVSDSFNSRIVLWNATSDPSLGAISVVNATTGLKSVVLPGVGQPRDVQPDCFGSLWFTDSLSNSVKFWSPSFSRTPITVFNGSSTFNNPRGILIDPGNANLFIANSNNNSILQISLTTCAISTLISGLNGPFGVSLDASGVFYISDQGSNTMKRFVSPGTAVMTPCSSNALPVPQCLSQTQTFSPSQSRSPTQTSSSTQSQTTSPTSTPSPRSTPSGSQTASQTATVTLTQTPSQVVTPSPTQSASQTVTASVTRSPSSSPTPSQLSTPSPSLTSSQTVTSSSSPTRSAIGTPSASPTPSVSQVSTATQYATSSSTVSPSCSLTTSQAATGSQAISPGSSNSQTTSLTPTSSATGSTAPTSSGTVSPSPTASPTVSTSRSQAVTASSSSTRSANGTPSPSVTPSSSLTPSQAATGTQAISFGSSYSQTNTPTFTASVSFTQVATATQAVTPSQSPSQTASLSSASTQLGTASVTGSASAAGNTGSSTQGVLSPTLPPPQSSSASTAPASSYSQPLSQTPTCSLSHPSAGSQQFSASASVFVSATPSASTQGISSASPSDGQGSSLTSSSVTSGDTQAGATNGTDASRGNDGSSSNSSARASSAAVAGGAVVGVLVGLAVIAGGVVILLRQRRRSVLSRKVVRTPSNDDGGAFAPTINVLYAPPHASPATQHSERLKAEATKARQHGDSERAPTAAAEPPAWSPATAAELARTDFVVDNPIYTGGEKATAV